MHVDFECVGNSAVVLMFNGWFAKRPLLKNTNNKNKLAWAKKHEQWALDRWKSVLWTDESKFEIFGSNSCVFVRRRVGERMISTRGVGVLFW